MMLEEGMYIMFTGVKLLREVKALFQYFGGEGIGPDVVLFGAVWVSHREAVNVPEVIFFRRNEAVANGKINEVISGVQAVFKL